MFKYKFLRNLLIVSTLVALTLPLLSTYVIYPSFISLLTKEKEREAIKIGRHLATTLKADTENSTQVPAFNAESVSHAIQLTENFDLWKIRFFSKDGVISFSTDSEEIGTKNTNSYFYEVVAQGNAYTKIVKKGGQSLEGSTLSLDVVESYAPVMINGNFIGAYEVYFDITPTKQAMDLLLLRVHSILYISIFGLLAILIVTLKRTATSLDSQKETERLKHEGDIRVSAIVENALDCIISIDEKGKVIEYNPVAEQVFGFKRDELIGSSLSEAIIPPAMRAAHEAGLRRYIESEEPHLLGKRIETTAINVDGHEFPTELSIIRTYSKGTPRFTAFLRDITERREMEKVLIEARDQAEKASKTKSEFLANMSHEIRTPMNGVLGMTALLKETPLNEEQQDYVDGILQSGQSLMSIINDILDYSKIEASKLELEDIDFDLEEILQNVIQLFAPQAQNKGIRLDLKLSPNCPTRLHGDPNRLRQVLYNLVNNAIKFTSEGRVQIDVTGETTDSGSANICIKVKDTGIGIAEDALKTLFVAFTQADSSTTRKYGGTGLGLAISRKLIHKMGGEIHVNSKLGEGSAFWVDLTLRLATEPEQSNSQSLQGERVLVVFSDSSDGQKLSEQLETLSLSVDTSNDTDRAIRIAVEAMEEGQPFLCCVIDSPAQDAMADAIVQAVRADETLANMPLIVANSENRERDTLHLSGKGLITYLTKPVQTDDIYKILNGIMEGSSETDQIVLAANR